MRRYSYTGIILGLLYLLLGVAVLVDELGAAPSSQTHGLGYLLYLLPWSIFLNYENIFIMLTATALNTSILYFVGKGIGAIFLKLQMLFKRDQ